MPWLLACRTYRAWPQPQPQLDGDAVGSAGNCSASGFYTDSSRSTQAFVINETSGTWGKATEVAAALNTGGNAWTYSVSCAAAGACSAGGFYTDSSGHGQAFVVSKP